MQTWQLEAGQILKPSSRVRSSPLFCVPAPAMLESCAREVRRRQPRTSYMVILRFLARTVRLCVGPVACIYIGRNPLLGSVVEGVIFLLLGDRANLRRGIPHFSCSILSLNQCKPGDLDTTIFLLTLNAPVGTHRIPGKMSVGYSSARPAGREHIPLYPKGFIAIRIVQLVLAVIILALSAWSLSEWGLVGPILSIFTVSATPYGLRIAWRRHRLTMYCVVVI